MAKRSHGEGSVYKLPNGRWRAQVSVDGRRHRDDGELGVAGGAGGRGSLVKRFCRNGKGKNFMNQVIRIMFSDGIDPAVVDRLHDIIEGMINDFDAGAVIFVDEDYSEEEAPDGEEG